MIKLILPVKPFNSSEQVNYTILINLSITELVAMALRYCHGQYQQLAAIDMFATLLGCMNNSFLSPLARSQHSHIELHYTSTYLHICSKIQWLSHDQNISYSGFYLWGPNFCEIYEVLTSSQILILKLLFYFREPATEHVLLAPGYLRKTYVCS